MKEGGVCCNVGRLNVGQMIYGSSPVRARIRCCTERSQSERPSAVRCGPITRSAGERPGRLAWWARRMESCTQSCPIRRRTMMCWATERVDCRVFTCHGVPVTLCNSESRANVSRARWSRSGSGGSVDRRLGLSNSWESPFLGHCPL